MSKSFPVPVVLLLLSCGEQAAQDPNTDEPNRQDDQPQIEQAASPSTERKSGIVCNKFSVSVALTNKKPDSVDARVRLRTDLPDFTEMMFGISRVHVDSGTRYSIDYVSEKTTVGEWKELHTFHLSNSEWKRKLKEQQNVMAKIGQPFTPESIEDEIEISFVVHVNQSNPLFGRANKHLSGRKVATDGLRVVRAEVRRKFPINQGVSESEYADPRNLIVGRTYRISKKTPLMPAFDVTGMEGLEGSLAAIKQIEAGGLIKIVAVKMKRSTNWYQVEARQADDIVVGSGWVNGIALIGQDIVRVSQ